MLPTALKRELQRRAYLPRLGAALLGVRPLAYVSYRLRLVALRVLLRTALHLLEIEILSYVFPASGMAPILMLRAAAGLTSTIWWGALEAQREELREPAARRDATRRTAILVRYAQLARLLMLGQLTLVAVWLMRRGSHWSSFDIFDAYAVAIALRMLLDTWVRLRQSSVFALTRIYRASSNLLVVDLWEVLSLFVLWHWVGPLAFSLALGSSALIRSVFTLHYVRRTERRLRLARPSLSSWFLLPPKRVWNQLRSLPWKRLLVHGLANLALQVDSLLVISLGSGLGGEEGYALALLFHAFSPYFGAGFGWSRVFYFDWKQLERFGSELLVRRLSRLLDWVAVLFPLLLGLLVVPIAQLLIPELLDLSLLVLLPFVVARSILALSQMKHLGLGRYRPLLWQTLLLVPGLALLTFTSAEPLWGLLVVSALCLLAAWAIRSSGQQAAPTTVILPLESWFASLARSPMAVELAWLQTSSSVRRNAVLGALAQAGFGPLHASGKRGIALVASSDGSSEKLGPTRRQILHACGGTLTTLDVMPISAPAGSLLCTPAALPLWNQLGVAPLLARWRAGATPASFLSELRERFPDSLWVTETTSTLGALSPSERSELARALRWLRPHRLSPPWQGREFELAVYRPSGLPQALCLIRRAGRSPAELRDWRDFVADRSLLDTLLGSYARPARDAGCV